MPLAETILGAVLGALLKVLTSPELVRFLRQEGFETKIKNWRKTLETINTVLGDAEENQLTNNAVKNWLDDLEELAYDAEDMLDEFEYEAIARKMKMDQLQSTKVWKHVAAGFCNWSLDATRFRFRMRSKVNDVTTRFDQLCELRGQLGLQVITAGPSSTLRATPQRPQEGHHRIEAAVYGRDEDKKKILEMVLKNDANFLVIPIVGLGGVGKTTLAREVFIASEVEFEVNAWVCVSDGEFDVTRVSKSILGNITGSSSLPDDLDTVQNKLKERVIGKKFLLVLDDVWGVDDGNWKKLLSPFKANALRSRIIVTTRLENVARNLSTNNMHQLDLLQPQDCLFVFAMCVIEKTEDIQNHPDKDLICEKVIEKCKGLPLAATTLGGLLRLEQIDGWLQILNNNKLWDLSEQVGSDIPAALKYSYHHLPSHLRRCFAYCAIFPKAYEFEIEEIVLLWIAQGLVQQSTENEPLEDLGSKFFFDLSRRSLFQQSSSNNGRTFVMHDLVHDLAEWAFGKRSLRLDGESIATVQSRGLEKVRHFSYTSDKYDRIRKFMVFQEVEELKTRIRTFFPIPQVGMSRYIANSIPSDLLPNLRRLRILSLQSYHVSEIYIPIDGLKHLRYLNLSSTKIRSLPESTSLLYNLQILLLRDCSRLVKLPSNFKYLIKLCHLDIKGAILIKEMPLGMEELNNLRKLSNFIVGKGVGSSLKDLMSLNMLRGELCIAKLDNVIDCDHRHPILRDKKDLNKLQLKWGTHFRGSRSEAIEEKVLDMLQPHKNLQELIITGYGGTKFPSWVGAASYSNMKVLSLTNCENCLCSPSLAALVSLEELTIKGMKGLTRIGCEFYGNGQRFKSLKTLIFEDLPVWTDWEPIEESEYGDAFLCLHQLSIKDCPQLSGSLPKCLFALEELVIENCKQLVVSFSNIPELCNLIIDGCKRIACDNPVEFKSLRYLSLSNILEFSNQLMQECFGKAELQQIKHNKYEAQLDEISPDKPPVGRLQSIKFLTGLLISNCSNIVSFPEVCSLPYLSKLRIHDCNALISLPEEMKTKNAYLESLEIKKCNSLAFIVRSQLPPPIKRLEIRECEKLESLWDDGEGSCSSTQGKENVNNTNSSFLEYLTVLECPSLMCSSSIIQLPATLKHLEFRGCPQLTKLSQSGQLPASLKHVSFIRCAQLTTIAERFLDSNTSLEVIKLYNCENLQLPNGLYNLRHIRELAIQCCSSIEFFPEGLADTNLRKLTIRKCEKLKALPIGLRNLNSLEALIIQKCPNITSFNPGEEFPTNLKYLEIGGYVNEYRPMVEWGLQNLTSLTSLKIRGCLDVESFPQQEINMMLPPSLTYLKISCLPQIGQGFQNLTSLQHLEFNSWPDLTSLRDQHLPSSLTLLVIWNCPNLTCFPEQGLPTSIYMLSIRDCLNLTCFPKQGLPSSLAYLEISDCPNLTSFPKQGLPSSLQNLEISNCPKLKEECKRNKGREWSRISNIPMVKIDFIHIFELEEDEEAQSSSWYRSCLTNPMHCCTSPKDDTLDRSSTMDHISNGSTVYLCIDADSIRCEYG